MLCALSLFPRVSYDLKTRHPVGKVILRWWVIYNLATSSMAQKIMAIAEVVSELIHCLEDMLAHRQAGGVRKCMM